MRPLSELIRPNIARLKPYSSARDEFSGAAEIFLDANENAFPADYNRYPDPRQRILKQAVAKWRKVAENQIFLGNGSDEAIDLLLRAFCQPGQDRIVICPPTYGMYTVAAGIQDAESLSVPLLFTNGSFQPDVDGLLVQAQDPKNKLLFLCSPNNPTGNLLEASEVEQILRGFPGLVVVDEAYIDFAEQGSFLPRLGEFPNLVVLQTFSKAWGMAGLRLGMAFAAPEIISVLNKIKAPYNLNQHTQAYVLEALAKVDEMETKRNELVAQREMLRERLRQISGVEHIYPSDANFLLVRFQDPHPIFQFLLDNNIIVRDRSSVVENTLRITVGTPSENEALLAMVEQFSRARNEIRP